ncbi:MAG: hypothetical protein ACYTEZ_14590 [Planctomycetota bacterium]|jgi:hypothetical protein
MARRLALWLALLAAGCDFVPPGQPAGEDTQIVQDTKCFRAQLEIQRLETEVAQYHSLRGAWPESWRVLRRSGLDPWGEEYLLELDGDRPIVYSAGPDREPGTGDDVYTLE